MPNIPFNNNFQYQQTYTALFVTGNMDFPYPLADSTGAPYQPGLLMCLYTSGGNSGLAGDYVAAGSNGQNVCIGVFVDQNYPYGTAGTATTGSRALIKVGGQGQGLVNAALSATTGADIPTGMAAVGARLINPPSGVTFWYWP